MFEGVSGDSVNAAAQYDVEIKLKRVGDGWDELSSGVGKFAGEIDALGSRIVGLGIGAAFAAGAAAVGAVTWGVVSLNREAENAAISIGTIFSVNGLAANVPAGITMAKDTIAEMRKDVQSLPVEFRDLQNIFKTAAIPLFQAGATREQAEKMSVKAAAAGSVMELDQSMVAREFGMLLAGRAGSHNRFGTMLGFSGDKAKQLNAEDPSKRLASISTELDKYSGALEQFKGSFQGLETTLIDHGKNFARLATAPVFEEVKNTMAEIGDWFNKNQSAIYSFAGHMGQDIRMAFLWGKREIEEWWPLIESFGETAEQRLVGIWETIQPYVQSFAGAMKEALADPNGTIDKLEDLFTMFMAVKGGSALLGAGGGIASIATGLGKGIGYAAGAGEAAEGGGLVAAGGAALGGSSAVVGASFLAAVAAWGAAVYLAVGTAKEYSAQTMADTQAIADAHAREIGQIGHAVKSSSSLLESIPHMSEMEARMASQADAYVTQMDATGWALNDVATEAALAAESLGRIADLEALRDKEGNERMDKSADDAMAAMMLVNKYDKGGMPGSSAAASKEAAGKPRMKGGHGGTSIQKVEIVVTSNQSPSRIARQVDARLAKLSNNRRVSPDVRNWSALDEE